MVNFSFSEFICHGCKRVYKFAESEAICPICGFFFCKKCENNGELGKHIESTIWKRM